MLVDQIQTEDAIDSCFLKIKVNRVKTYKKLRNVLKYHLSIGSVRIFFEPNRIDLISVGDFGIIIPSIPYISSFIVSRGLGD